jgi:SOS-response transcriptional repressor LexA
MRGFHILHDRLPTKRNIADHFGMRSTNGPFHHLKVLQKEGYIVKDGTGWRFNKQVKQS